MTDKWKKPNWYPDKDIKSTENGWVYTKNHNEVLTVKEKLNVIQYFENPDKYEKPKNIIYTESIAVDDNIYIEEGKNIKLNYTVNPTNASHKGCVFTIDDSTIATIDSYGIITANKSGKTIIRINSIDGNSSNSITLNVTEATNIITNIKINQDDTIILDIGDYKTINLEYTPKNAKKEDYTITSTNENIVSINGNNIIAKESGKVLITIKVKNTNIVRNIDVIVKGISISFSKNIKIFTSTRIITNAYPSHSKINFISKDTEIATVDTQGNVYAKSVGNANIEIYMDNKLYKELTIHVEQPILISNISIVDNLQLSKGDIHVLEPIIAPYNATMKKLIYSSTNVEVVTINDVGVINAISNGEAKIIIRSIDGSDIIKYIDIKVSDIEVTDIITLTTITIIHHEKLYLPIDIVPIKAVDKSIISTIDNDNIEYIDGYIYGVKVGYSKLTLSHKNIKKEVSINILPKLVTNIEFPLSVECYLGDKVNLGNIRIYPIDATDTSYTLYYNEQIITENYITTNTVGESSLTIKSNDGNITKNIKLLVKPILISSISIDLNDMSIGDVCPISYTIYPNNATNKNFNIKSSNNNLIITNNTIVANGIGSSILTITSDDGNFISTKEISIFPILVNKIDISSIPKLYIGDEVIFYYNIYPINATNKDVSIFSNNNSIVKIIDNKIYCIGVGLVDLFITSLDGSGVYSKVSVNVYPILVEKVKLSIPKLKPHDIQEIEYEVVPSNATNKNIAFTTNDSSISTINGNYIKGLKNGNYTLSVSSQDGNYHEDFKSYVDILPINRIEVLINDMYINEIQPFIYNIYPSDASIKDVDIIIDNKDILKVENNKIIPTSIGSSGITIKSKDGSNIYSYKEIKVKPILISNIDINYTDIKSSFIGDSKLIELSIYPLNATDSKVNISVNNDNIIYNNGMIYYNKLGKSILKISSNDGSFTIEYTITVLPILITDVIIKNNNDNYIVGNTYKIETDIIPSNATNKELQYMFNGNIVNDTIKITDNGTYPIIVSTKDSSNISKTKTISCITMMGSIVAKNKEMNVSVGKSMKIDYDIYPTTTSNKSVLFSSSDESIVTVNNSGSILGISNGNAYIYISSVDVSNIKETIKVTVNTLINDITLSIPSQTINVGSVSKLSWIIYPKNASNKNVKITLSNNHININDNGDFYVNDSGITSIYVSAQDGSNITRKIDITCVDIKISNITLPLLYTIRIGDNIKLYPNITPSNATNKRLTWSSSNSNIVSVDSNGNVTARRLGIALIYATTQDGTNMTTYTRFITTLL